MNRESASFRDPSGYVFYREGKIYRAVSHSYKESYDHLMNSGLYQELTNNGLLVEHEEVGIGGFGFGNDIYKVLSPQEIPFISYPSEWCFGQLKQAALLTLQVHEVALKYQMVLKDASSFNIQFLGTKAKFIDTLSFEPHVKGHPWSAYRQFCEHFLCPLLLMSKVDIGLHKLLETSLNGVPLHLTSKLLPFTQKINPSVFMHVVLHAQAQKKYQSDKISTTNSLFTVDYLKHLAKGLRRMIEKLEWEAPTLWGNYYEDDVEGAYLEEKKSVVQHWIQANRPSNVWDLGANDGTFSQLASALGIQVISMDVDLGAVERNFKEAKSKNQTNLLPLVFNFSNPTPGYGWALNERKSLFARGKGDLIMALGLIHHMVITEGISLEQISSLLSKICRVLIIEFVPKSDPKVIRLLQNREDIFNDYSEERFLEIFGCDFDLNERLKFVHGQRSIYWFTSKK